MYVANIFASKYNLKVCGVLELFKLCILIYSLKDFFLDGTMPLQSFLAGHS